MRRLILSFIISLVVTVAVSRDVIPIGGTWMFSKGCDISPTALSQVIIPHTYNYDAIASSSAMYKGIANYIKSVNIPYNFAGKRLYLRFHGISGDVDLFVNGRYAASHHNDYSAFTVDITTLAKVGTTNNIWLRVSNSDNFEYIPINGDFLRYGGVYRKAELIATSHTAIAQDGVFLRQIKVTEAKADITASVKLTTTKPAFYNVTVDVFDPEKGASIARGDMRVRVEKDGLAEIPLVIENPRLWNGLRDAYLYDFVIKVGSETHTLDSITIPMGLRHYGINPVDGFVLNGKPYKINGVTYVPDRAGRGIAMTDDDIEADFDIMLEMGVNAIRLKNYPQSDKIYELCDRYGVILWSEIPLLGPQNVTDNGFINKPSLKNSAKQALSDMIAQRYNNTSVLFWGLFSNISAKGDSPVSFIKELNALSNEKDPTRLTIASSDQDGDINFITNLIGWSQYMGWKEGSVSDLDIWLQQLTKNWAGLKSAIGEYGAGGSISNQRDTVRSLSVLDISHSERRQTLYHREYYSILKNYPSIWGSFVHSMFDYGTPYWSGSDTPGVSDMGLVTYDRRTKKDAFYYYKSQWNKNEPFVYVSERRWSRRRNAPQSIIIFSNQEEVELVVNNISLGQKLGKDGVFVWDAVALKHGVNTIEAFSGRVSDNAEIIINTIRL